MSLSLHNLKVNKKASKKKKRVGRGNSSGHGTYSTRGLKGQRSRSGGKGGLKRLGMRNVILATPKKKGFKSARPKAKAVNLSVLNDTFKDGSSVNSKTLFESKIIDSLREPVKILGTGELKLKNLKISGLKISESAKGKIEKLGGEIK